MPPAPESRDWHATLRQWAKPPSETEEEKASNAADMIRTAIRASDALKNRSVDVYATGSYRNNTNARTESDIDVAVVLKDCFFYELPKGASPETFGLGTPATYGLTAFRGDVEAALRAKFGSGMTAGDKAFDLRENTYRLNADVAAFVQHRRYSGRKTADGSWHFYEGVEMRSRRAPDKSIINWHEAHYRNGVTKNDATGGRFKRITRILKRLRTEMEDSSSSAECEAASHMPSFFIECLVYNVPVEQFNQSTETYYEDTRAVIGWLWTRIDKAEHNDFKEVSEFKWLFRSGQMWTAEQAKAFLQVAWNYIGFGRD